MSEEIENRLNEKFGYFAILGGERFYNGCFDPSTKTMEVAEFIKNEVSEAITLTEERVRKEKDEEWKSKIIAIKKLGRINIASNINSLLSPTESEVSNDTTK